MKLAVFVRYDLYTGSLEDLALALIRYGLQHPNLPEPDSVEFFSVAVDQQDAVINEAVNRCYAQACYANKSDEFPIQVVGPIENGAMDKLTEGLSLWVP